MAGEIHLGEVDLVGRITPFGQNPSRVDLTPVQNPSLFCVRTYLSSLRPYCIASREMSSLAGALDDFSSHQPKVESTSHVPPSEDVDMNSEPQSTRNESEEEQDENHDEEMSDLFGNDNDVEVQRHARSV